MKVNYAHTGVVALCMSPSIAASVMLLQGTHILLAFAAYLLLLAVYGSLYYAVVQHPRNTWLSPCRRYWVLVAAQIAFWYMLIWINIRL